MIRKILLSLFFLLTGVGAMGGNAENLYHLRFVDSDGKVIPFFGEGMDTLLPDEIPLMEKYLRLNMVDVLFPENPMASPANTSDRDAFQVDKKLPDEEEENHYKNYAVRNGPGEWDNTSFILFLDGSVYHRPGRKERKRLEPGKYYDITIPGHLGSGRWGDLGRFLFEAAEHWRFGRGSRSKLVARCNEWIQVYLKEGDREWAGRLVFVRELWLGESARVGLFGTLPTSRTSEEAAQMPWKGVRASFGGGQGGKHYEIRPYRAFKKVLDVNPADTRARMWVEVMPWLDGFIVEEGPGKPRFADYVEVVRKVYEKNKAWFSEPQKEFFLWDYVDRASSQTFMERTILKAKGLKTIDAVQWALEELDRVRKPWPFLKRKDLQYQIEFMKDPNRRF
jgi:hypothetical protein